MVELKNLHKLEKRLRELERKRKESCQSDAIDVSDSTIRLIELMIMRQKGVYVDEELEFERTKHVQYITNLKKCIIKNER